MKFRHLNINIEHVQQLQNDSDADYNSDNSIRRIRSTKSERDKRNMYKK